MESARLCARSREIQGWSGHLWANRYYSTPLDEVHLWAAVKYVELNPVRARLALRAEDYEWSSARAHALGEAHPLLATGWPLPALQANAPPMALADWTAWLAEGLDEETLTRLRANTNTGRPCGTDGFVARIESLLGRILRRQKPGRKPIEDRNK